MVALLCVNVNKLMVNIAFLLRVCYYKHKMNPEQPYENGQPMSPVVNGQVPSPQAPTYQPQQPPVAPASQPAPNAYNPVVPSSPTAQPHNANPYEFIFSEKHQPKQGLFSGASMTKRIMVIVGGLVVLAVLAAILMSLFVPKDTSLEKLTSILQEQEEIVRVADLSSASAANVDVKNLAVNVSLSVGTNSTSLQTYLTTHKVKITKALLATKQDSKTDTLLTNAKSTNTFDHTAAQTLQSLLVTYRSDLNTTYQDVKGTNARKELLNSYKNADLLITEANKVVGQ